MHSVDFYELRKVEQSVSNRSIKIIWTKLLQTPESSPVRHSDIRFVIKIKL